MFSSRKAGGGKASAKTCQSVEQWWLDRDEREVRDWLVDR